MNGSDLVTTTFAGSADLAARLEQIVGPQGLVRDDADLRGYLSDWRDAYRGRAAAVVRPGNTEEVAAVVALCREAGVAVVPQGGNTGLCGGAVPIRRARRWCSR